METNPTEQAITQIASALTRIATAMENIAKAAYYYPPLTEVRRANAQFEAMERDYQKRYVRK